MSLFTQGYPPSYYGQANVAWDWSCGAKGEVGQEKWT